MDITVTKIGEMTGWCREYFKNVDTGQIYTKITWRGHVEWHTTDKLYGEPNCPLKGDTTILIVERSNDHDRRGKVDKSKRQKD